MPFFAIRLYRDNPKLQDYNKYLQRQMLLAEQTTQTKTGVVPEKTVIFLQAALDLIKMVLELMKMRTKRLLTVAFALLSLTAFAMFAGCSHQPEEQKQKYHP